MSRPRQWTTVSIWPRVPLSDKLIRLDCHVYAPNLAIQYQLGRQRNIVLASLMPKSMEYQSVIEAVIGFVLSGVADCSDPSSPEGHELLRRRGSALIGLQKRLKCPELCAGDGTLHTILPFLSIDTMISEPHDVATHLQGLRRHVELRGGLASSSFTPYQRRLITTVEVSCRVHVESTIMRTGRLPAAVVLEYPAPPLPVHIGQLLTPLPIGLVRLAHQSHFSVQMIEMLAAVQAFLLPTPRTTLPPLPSLPQLPPPSSIPQLDTRMIRLDILPHLTPLESVIWLALGLNPRGFPGEGFPRSLPILRKKFRNVVANHPAIIHAAARFHVNFKWCLQEFYDNDAVMNVLAWVAINVTSSIEEDEGEDAVPLLCGRAGPTAFRIPRVDVELVYSRFGREWEGLRAVLCQFLWDDGLMVRWESAWRRFEKVRGWK